MKIYVVMYWSDDYYVHLPKSYHMTPEGALNRINELAIADVKRGFVDTVKHAANRYHIVTEPVEE